MTKRVVLGSNTTRTEVEPNSSICCAAVLKVIEVQPESKSAIGSNRVSQTQLQEVWFRLQSAVNMSPWELGFWLAVGAPDKTPLLRRADCKPEAYLHYSEQPWAMKFRMHEE